MDPDYCGSSNGGSFFASGSSVSTGFRFPFQEPFGTLSEKLSSPYAYTFVPDPISPLLEWHIRPTAEKLADMAPLTA